MVGKNMNGLKLGAYAEGRGTVGSDAVGNDDAGQLATAGKCAITNGSDAVGNENDG